jgi:two-component system, NtrC family, sensor histidine kinase PilS
VTATPLPVRPSSVSIPIHAEPVSGFDDPRRRLAGLVLLRVLVSSALFGAALATSFSQMDEEAVSRAGLFGYLTAAYGASAFEFVLILARVRLGSLSWVHIGVETALAAWLLALTGGVESPFTFLLLLSTVHGALAAGSAGAFAAATLATASLVALQVGLPIPGWIPPPHPDSARSITLVATASGGCFATAALASYLTQRLRRAGRELSARERELRQLGELYLNVAESLRSGLMTLGVDRRITLLNGTGAAILGVEVEGVLGRSLLAVLPELGEVLASAEGNGRDECEILRAGRRLLLGFTLSPLRDPSGEPLGSVLTFQDLTDQRRLENALRTRSHLASLGELSAGLAHEVRNPLAALSGAAQMLSEPEDRDTVDTGKAVSAEDQKLLEVIRRETKHLDRLVSDFLVFARPPQPSLAEGDLSEIVSSTVEAFQASEQLGERVLVCSLAQLHVRFDSAQIRQVIWNLLRNAVEATGPQGRVSVQLRADGESVLLEVADDGPGIPAEFRERIFEPFFTTKERGTGLGLALVGRIIGAHGGTIELDAAMAKGTRFVVRLPRLARVRSSEAKSGAPLLHGVS